MGVVMIVEDIFVGVNFSCPRFSKIVKVGVNSNFLPPVETGVSRWSAQADRDTLELVGFSQLSVRHPLKRVARKTYASFA